jgi:hypothetical protein
MSCPACGDLAPGTGRFCQRCGSPLSANCGHCGAPVSPGTRFCTACGASVATPGPGLVTASGAAGGSAAASSRLSVANWVSFVGFVLATAGALLPWAEVGDISVYPLWGDTTRFRFGDWWSANAVDGLVAGGVAAAGAALMLMQHNGRAVSLSRWLWKLCAVLLILVVVLELQYVVSFEGVGIGLGLVAMAAGTLLVISPVLVPYIIRRLLYPNET